MGEERLPLLDIATPAAVDLVRHARLAPRRGTPGGAFFVLTFSGFKEGACQEIIDIIQPDSALLTVRICMGLIPSLLVYWGLLIMRDWKDKEEVQQVKVCL